MTKVKYVIQWQSYKWVDALSKEYADDSQFLSSYPTLVDSAIARSISLICDTRWRGVKRTFNFEDDGKTIESISNKVLICSPVSESKMMKDYKLNHITKHK